ncbi:dynactin [Acrasis kona]|uniref:Dynactin subunit 6 n=1 Tax=Acrasis kona TaxID=1008807 RepID=A0AAW2YRB3_9EUKA
MLSIFGSPSVSSPEEFGPGGFGSDELKLMVQPGAMVCMKTEFVMNSQSGDVYIGPNTIIHPHCIIESGPNSGGIHIGKNNIIEEKVHIINYGSGRLAIGDNNIIQAGCIIKSQEIGRMNNLEPKVILENDSIIGNNCHIGSLLKIREREHVPNWTVTYGDPRSERVISNAVEQKKWEKNHLQNLALQKEYLTKTLRKYYKIRPCLGEQ